MPDAKCFRILLPLAPAPCLPGRAVVFVGHQAFKAWLKYALNEWYEGFDTLQTPTELGSGD